MSITEMIVEQIQGMPESMQVDVLDFVRYLKSKAKTKDDERDWSEISLSFAMRDIEDEECLYSIEDIKESV